MTLPTFAWNRCLAATLILLTSLGSAQAGDVIRWIENDPAAAHAQARQRNVPVVVLLSASWSVPAQRLEQAFHDSTLQLSATDFVFLRLDADSAAGRAFIQNHRVTGVPTVSLLQPQADDLVEINRLERYEEALFLAGWLEASRGGQLAHAPVP